MQIAKHTFLVTGGSSGLGAACADELLRRGANVVRFDLQPPTSGANSTANEAFVAGDVTDPAGVSQAIETALSRFGGLHGAINCAGILRAARVVGKSGPHDLAMFEQVIRVNLIGTFNVARLAAAAIAAMPAGDDGERGVLVHTASIAAFDGQIGQAAYAASKAGVAGMTLPLARDLARHGIRVIAIAPGVFETAMMAPVDDEIRTSLSEATPFPPRFGQPTEFASLACHAIENRMLNGCVLRLDGALRMPAR